MVTLKDKVNKSLALLLCGLLCAITTTGEELEIFYGMEIMKPRKLVCGVGLNDAGYVVVKYGIAEENGVRKRKRVWICPYYRVWKDMLKRCYSIKFQERNPTYAGCTVSKDWLTFTNFKSWMVAQDFEGKQLDKDLLIVGNKIYSPETCMFVSGVVNNFTTDRGNDRGEWLIGVSLHKQAGKFEAYCRNPFTKKREHLGYFACEKEAHEAWRKRKLELAHELAAIQTDPRVVKALTERYSKPISEVSYDG